jgi:hypothetical protein
VDGRQASRNFSELGAWQWPPGTTLPILAQRSDLWPCGQKSKCQLHQSSSNYALWTTRPHPTMRRLSFTGRYRRRVYWGIEDLFAVPFLGLGQPRKRPATDTFRLSRAAIFGYEEIRCL